MGDGGGGGQPDERAADGLGRLELHRGRDGRGGGGRDEGRGNGVHHGRGHLSDVRRRARVGQHRREQPGAGGRRGAGNDERGVQHGGCDERGAELQHGAVVREGHDEFERDDAVGVLFDGRGRELDGLVRDGAGLHERVHAERDEPQRAEVGDDEPAGGGAGAGERAGEAGGGRGPRGEGHERRDGQPRAGRGGGAGEGDAAGGERGLRDGGGPGNLPGGQRVVDGERDGGRAVAAGDGTGPEHAVLLPGARDGRVDESGILRRMGGRRGEDAGRPGAAGGADGEQHRPLRDDHQLDGDGARGDVYGEGLQQCGDAAADD